MCLNDPSHPTRLQYAPPDEDPDKVVCSQCATVWERCDSKSGSDVCFLAKGHGMSHRTEDGYVAWGDVKYVKR